MAFQTRARLRRRTGAGRQRARTAGARAAHRRLWSLAEVLPDRTSRRRHGMAAGKPLGNCAIFRARGDPTPTGVTTAGEKTTRYLPYFRAGQLRGDGRPGGFVFPRADARRDAQRGSPGGPLRGRQCWHHGDQLACAARHRRRLRRVGARSVHRVRGQQRSDRPLRPRHGVCPLSRLPRRRAVIDGDQTHPNGATHGRAGSPI